MKILINISKIIGYFVIALSIMSFLIISGSYLIYVIYSILGIENKKIIFFMINSNLMNSNHMILSITSVIVILIILYSVTMFIIKILGILKHINSIIIVKNKMNQANIYFWIAALANFIAITFRRLFNYNVVNILPSGSVIISLFIVWLLLPQIKKRLKDWVDNK